MFTQRHYIAIAAELSRLKPESGGDPHSVRNRVIQWRRTVESFCRLFACDNHKFKESRFVDACDYQYEEDN